MQVDTLMQQFRERYCIRYVPKQARYVFIELAMDLYPKASKHSINERIRLRKKTIFEGGLSYLDEKKSTRGISPSDLDSRFRHHPHIVKQSGRLANINRHCRVRLE